MEGYAVTVQDVRKAFGTVEALRGVTLDVPKGTVLGLLGPNGAGKTTLIRILTTLMSADHGTAVVEGHNVAGEPQAVRGVIGLAGQYAAVDENLTGRENLVMVARLYHLSIKQSYARAAELLQKFDLTEAANRTLKTYSGGMRRRLDLAAALVNRPPVLFLDEPTTGLDPQSRLALWQIIRELVKEGTTVVLTTQYLEEADHLAQDIVVIDHGQVIAHGTPSQLKSRVGGDVLEIHLVNPAQAHDALSALVRLGTGEGHSDAVLGTVSLPVAGGTKVLPHAIRALDEADIAIEDLQLRRPTLDEVFLKLTTPALPIHLPGTTINIPV